MALPEEARRAGAPASWLPYVATPDVDVLVQQAMSLGARVLTGPLDIPGVGRFAVVADPQGAVFAPFRGEAAPAPSQAPPHAGQFSSHDLATTNPEAALAFYQALFGWQRIEAMPMPDGVYQIFGLNGESMGGIYSRAADGAAPSQWLSYVHVPDADGAARRVTTLGGRLVTGPVEVPGGDRIAQCVDPQGAAFALHALPGSRGERPGRTARATPSRRARHPARPRRAPRPGRKRKPVRKTRKRRR
jgi:hypothetical protein